MSNIQIFQNEQFGQVRIAMSKSNEPVFCLADVCNVIGISNARNVKTRLEDDDVCQMDTADSLGRNQQVTFVTEGGLYDVIIRSDSEKAKPFRKWVTGEVLPSIRKHGMYATDVTIEKMVSDPDFAIQLLTNLKEERQKRIKAEQAKQKTQTLLEQKSEQLDESQEWYSIKRWAKEHHMNWRSIDWRKLKAISYELGYEIKKIFDGNYGQVNIYHRRVFEAY